MARREASVVVALQRRRSLSRMEEKLVASGLSKDYGGVRALDDVSLELCAGEIVGLIGPNGSGKTTLLNCLSGALRPTAGTIAVGGRSLAGRPPREFARCKVARTFQNISLFSTLTVAENVEASCVSGAGMRRDEARQVALRELASIGIERFADSFAEQLAYGDRRRLEVARALATDPRFLLLDEPAAGMNDAESRALGEFTARVREERGCGVLIVEHDLQLIMRHCDRIYVLNEGRLIAHGTAGEVQQHPAVVAAYTGGVHVT
jgi:branched-chain amino acid transport system ATP-binding protein